jgi:crotonobetainyl-CoA:carnitine CoA-transferase CaiB-like acyl-CoA transferase
MSMSDRVKDTMLGAYRVLDFTDERGFYCGQMLGNLGADVIKVEKPGGDEARNHGPFFRNQADPERSLYWMAFNNCKRGITLDLESLDGREIFKQLAESADVVVESYAPGYLEKLGLGYTELERINPKIVLASVTPYGQSGPYRDYKATDLVSWGMGGLLYVTGDPDRPPMHVSHIPLAHLMAGMDAASGVAIALLWRRYSGKGQQVDVSIQDSMVKTAWMIHEFYYATGKEFPRSSSMYSVPASPVQLQLVWPVKDGYVLYFLYTGAFGAEEDKRLVKWLEEEGLVDGFIKSVDWANLDWRQKKREDGDRIMAYFGRLFKSKTKAELLDGGYKRDILVQPVCTPKDIFEHPQFKETLYWQDVEHDDLDVTMKYPGRFCLASETPLKIWRRAPLIGEHNLEIYEKELGITRQKLISLKQAGVI